MAMSAQFLLLLFLIAIVVLESEAQRVFDMMDDSKGRPSSGPSAFYQRKSYLQPFYHSPGQLFWRRSD